MKVQETPLTPGDFKNQDKPAVRQGTSRNLAPWGNVADGVKDTTGTYGGQTSSTGGA